MKMRFCGRFWKRANTRVRRPQKMAIARNEVETIAKSEFFCYCATYTNNHTDKLCHRTKPEVKRQRTSSRSPSNSPVIESEDDSTRASAPKQKPRGAAARSQREKEQREKEREQERTEAANRRKGRAERRKADGMFGKVMQECFWLTVK